MSLADQIIEHGPYRDGDSLPIEVQVADAEEVNALRDELIAARALKELLGRFEVEGDGNEVDSVIVLRCTRCKWAHEHVIQSRNVTWHTLDLAELVQRASEHTEVCR